MSDWKDRLILISGAGSGIGAALASHLASLNARLILTDIDGDALGITVAKLEQAVVLSQAMDVSCPAQWQALAQQIEEKFAGLDVLVNNAGVSNIDFFDEMSEAQFNRVMDINFGGVVSGCRYMLPLLKRRPWALIVNVASIFSMITVPCQSAYHASKFAVRGFSGGLQQDLKCKGSDIDVVCVLPGGVKTNIVNASVTEHGNIADFSQHFDAHAMTTPEKAARIIERGMRKRKSIVLVGLDARFLSFIQRLLGQYTYHITDRLLGVSRLLKQTRSG